MSSYKSLLNEYCQKAHLEYPMYTPERAGDVFVCCVVVDGEEYRSVEGHATKKDAEQDAARVALQNFVQLHREAKSVKELLACVEREGKSGSVTWSPSKPSVNGTGGGMIKMPVEASSLPSPAVLQPPQMIPVSISSNQGPSVQLPQGVPNQSVPASAVRLTCTSSFLPNKSPLQDSIPFTSSVRPAQAVPDPVKYLPSPAPLPSSSSSDRLVQQVPVAVSSSPTLHPTPSPVTPIKSDMPRESPSALQSPDSESPHLLQKLLSSPESFSSPVATQLGRGIYKRSDGTPQPGRMLPLAINFPRQSPPTSSLPSEVLRLQPRPHLSARLNPDSAPFRPVAPLVGIPIRPRNQPSNPAPIPSGPYAPPPPSNSSVHSAIHPIGPEYDFVKILADYCVKCNFKQPTYSTTETNARFMASVVVGSKQFRGSRSHESFDAAKENAALVALACLGIQALGLNVAAGGVGGGVVRNTTGDVAAPWVTSTALSPHSVHSLPVSVRSRGTSENSSDLSSHSDLPTPGGPALPSATTSPEASLIPPDPPSSSSTVSPGSLNLSPRPSNSVAPKLHPPSFYKDSSPSEKVSVPFSQPGSLPLATVTQAVVDFMAMENYKTALNTYCQQNHLPLPKYDCTYPEDEVGYIVVIRVDGKTFKSSPQGTKRGAESMAASLALKGLGISIGQNGTEDVRNSGNHGGALQKPPQIPEAERSVSYKNLLQEYLQKSNSSLPMYRTEREEGSYVSIVSVKLPPDGSSRSFRGKPHANKKAAEQECAKRACVELGIVRS